LTITLARLQLYMTQKHQYQHSIIQL